MARDPWKRAYDRKRLERGGGDPAKDQPRLRRRSPAGGVILVLLLVLLAAAAVTAWYYRGLWLPPVRDELPPAVADLVPEPRVHVDYSALEQGVGGGLVLLGDYLGLIAGTREMQPDWQVLQTGSETLRLESDGIKVYVRDGLIQTYNLEVSEFFAADKWRSWHAAWRAAGISPELTWTAFSGEEQPAGGPTEHLYTSQEAVKLPEGWMHRAFNLEFHNGRLRRLEGRLEFGPADNAADG